jgi:molecular chaperone DnaK (HSP70)
MAMQRIKDEAENAKKQLSQTEKVDIMIPFITVASDGTPRNLEYTLTRAHFEKICDDLIKKCKAPVKNAIEDAKIDIDDIDEVLLVGGSTRMPWVKGAIKDLLGKDAKATVNPDEAVAA